jgi:hypothetical protein
VATQELKDLGYAAAAGLAGAALRLDLVDRLSPVLDGLHDGTLPDDLAMTDNRHEASPPITST